MIFVLFSSGNRVFCTLLLRGLLLGLLRRHLCINLLCRGFNCNIIFTFLLCAIILASLKLDNAHISKGGSFFGGVCLCFFQALRLLFGLEWILGALQLFLCLFDIGLRLGLLGFFIRVFFVHEQLLHFLFDQDAILFLLFKVFEFSFFLSQLRVY